MESLNIVLLAGKVQGVHPGQSQSSRSFRFTIATKQMYVDPNDGVRMWDPEVHEVKLPNHGTISKYIQPGKNMVVSGRLKYGKTGPYVLAEKVHFAGGDHE